MTKLRERMIQDMVLRGLAPSTQRAYLQAVTKFSRHYGRSPDRISNDPLKAYLLYLHLQEKRAASTCNVAAAALRFLFHKTLGRPHTDFDVPMARRPSKLPLVLSRDEVARLLTCTSAYRLQELAFSGLDRSTRRRLDRAAADLAAGRNPAPLAPKIKPGTRLLREWQGKVHEVIVLEKGVDYRGESWPSLSAVAREITGTRWSGPRFFGLKGGSPNGST